jgi:uncharacterized DUF497 family protein
VELGGLRFEWDARKAWRCIADDLRHSAAEQRFVLLGQTARRRLLVVMFTERGNTIRLISARKVTRREQKEYEENST